MENPTSLLKLAMELQQPKSNILYWWHQGIIKEAYFLGKQPIFDRIPALIALQAHILQHKGPGRPRKHPLPEVVEAVLS